MHYCCYPGGFFLSDCLVIAFHYLVLINQKVVSKHMNFIWPQSLRNKKSVINVLSSTKLKGSKRLGTNSDIIKQATNRSESVDSRKTVIVQVNKPFKRVSKIFKIAKIFNILQTVIIEKISIVSLLWENKKYWPF